MAQRKATADSRNKRPRTTGARATATPDAANGTVRRRPRQSRAQHTARALQEAFVHLLDEQDYGSITIREIVLVAGTGLGSFYQYFASKEDLARICLHLRSKALLGLLREAGATRAGATLTGVADAIVDAMIDAHRVHPTQWGSHYLLERHLSGADAYRRMYDRFVDAWAAALGAAADAPPTPQRLRELARVSHTLIYGMLAHTFIGTGGRPDLQALARQTRRALHGVLRPGDEG